MADTLRAVSARRWPGGARLVLLRARQVLGNRRVLAFLTTAILIVAAAEWAIWIYAARTNAPELLGMDARFYVQRAQSWLDGTGFYLPWQLTGKPYYVEDGAVTYPPYVLVLLVPFALGVPLILWWAIPLAVIGLGIWRMRPAPWAWPILACAVLWPRAWVVVLLGNPAMWALAAVVAGMAWRWTAVAVLIKPTFAPFAFLGFWDRRWLPAMAVGVAVALAFAPMWGDYLTAVTHAESTRGYDYLLGEWPLALAIVVAGLGRWSKL